MKIVFILKYNLSYINHFDEKNGEIKSYRSYLEKIIEDHFLMYSSYVKYLRKNHQHEVELIIPNWNKLNQLWADQHEVTFSSEEELIQLQLEALKPDLIFMNSNFEYYPIAIKQAKQIEAKLCTWISCPIPDNLKLEEFDVIFTLFPPYVELFEKKGVKVVLTQAGFDPGLLTSLESDIKHDLSFVGGIGGYHKKREEYLKYLIPKTGMKVWGYGFSSENRIKRLAKNFLNRFVYTKAYQGGAWGRDMFQILHSSKITFNAHGDIAGKYSVNMRMFEATGCGALLLTEESDYLTNFFEPGKEVITYTDQEDALNKIQYYLQHEDERQKVAKAGQKRTMEHYSYESLVKVLDDEFLKLK